VTTDEAFGFEFGIGVRDSGAVDAQLRRQFATCGNALSGPQIASMNEGTNLVAQLDIERNVTFGLQQEWNHWLTPSGQFILPFPYVKSQFVFPSVDYGRS
jgi:hypothetical protein